MSYLLIIASLFNAPGTFLDGLAAKDRLWLRDADNRVTVYDRASGKSSVGAEHVLSMDRGPDGGVIALMEVSHDVAAKRTIYELRDIAPKAAIASRFPLDDDRALAIIVGSGPPTIITERTIMSLDKGSWQAARLTAPLKSTNVAKGAQTNEGVLVGFEGGGLYAVNRMTGLTRQVKLGDAPLTGLTAVISDRAKPECGFASIAQQQLSGGGAVVRVCGPQAESIYAKQNKDGSTSPILGIVATDKGWVGLGGGKLLRWTGGKVKESTSPRLKSWKGLTLSFNPELVLVQVTSRETPLVVPVR